MLTVNITQEWELFRPTSLIWVWKSTTDSNKWLKFKRRTQGRITEKGSMESWEKLKKTSWTEAGCSSRNLSNRLKSKNDSLTMLPESKEEFLNTLTSIMTRMSFIMKVTDTSNTKIRSTIRLWGQFKCKKGNSRENDKNKSTKRKFRSIKDKNMNEI